MEYKILVKGGLPAIAQVTAYIPHQPATWTEPECGPDIEYDLCDSRGRPAPWIEKRLTQKDRDEICTEVMCQIKQDKDIHYDNRGRWWEEP